MYKLHVFFIAWVDFPFRYCIPTFTLLPSEERGMVANSDTGQAIQARHYSPHLCVGFLFLILYNPPPPLHPPLLLRRPLFTHHLSHNFVTHHLSHTPSFAHTLLSQLCHPPSFTHNFVIHPSFTHNFVTHHLSHTTLSHTIFHTQLCHTPSFTHNFVTHTHTIFHTQRCHTHHLLPTTLSHTPSFTHTTLSHTIFHTQLCHTPSFTHNFVTHHLSHTTLSHTILAWLLETTCCTWLAGVARLVAVGRPGRRATLCGRRGTSWHPPGFHLAGVALGNIYLRLAWQAWHFVTSTFV